MSRLLDLQNRFYDRIRSRSAYGVATKPAIAGGFDSLRDHKYAVVVTFKRNGQPVPTPVWFGLDDAGRMYVRTPRDAAKVKRLRHDPRVRVAPSTVRGRPLASAVEGTARVVPPTEEAHAEDSIQGNYGLFRRLYEGVGGALAREDLVYLEVTPRTPG
jgi:PPOX class probable F420-dependent enzyme